MMQSRNHVHRKKLHRFLPLFLVFAMLISLFPATMEAGEMGHDSLLNTEEAARYIESAVTESTYEQKAQEALFQAKQYYLMNPPNFQDTYQGSSSDFWTFQAMWGSGIDLKDEALWTKGSPSAEPNYWQQGSEKAFTGTEYAGAIIGTLLLEQNPHQFGQGGAQRDLIEELVEKQREDGTFANDYFNHIWPMIALDVVGADYDVHSSIRYMLDSQTADGNFPWGMDGGIGWTLLALANHLDQPGVREAVDRAVDYLHEELWIDGELLNNANSIAVAISGLVAVGEDLFSHRWTRDGNNLVTSFIEAFQLEDGSFRWMKTDPKTNGMATYQAVIAIADVVHGQTVLSRLKDAYGAKQPIEQITFTLRIEGSQATIYPEQTLRTARGNTLLDVTLDALEQAGIPYVEYYGLLSSIDGEESGQFTWWDGWNFAVNGEAPHTMESGYLWELMAEDYLVQPDDEIVWYYGNVKDIYEGFEEANEIGKLTLLPLIKISPEKPIENEPLQVHITAQHHVFDAGYDLVEYQALSNVGQADIEFNGKTYHTGEDGIVTIPTSDVKAGTYELKVSRQVEQSYPRLVRTSQTVTVAAKSGGGPGGGIPPVEEQITLSVDKGAKGGSILSSAQITLQKVDTPYSVLVRALPGQVDATGSGAEVYVRGIAGLYEYDAGPQSGWTYSVNGQVPDYGAGSYILKDGDQVKWLYTTGTDGDSGSDGGNGGGIGGGGVHIAPGPVTEQPSSPDKEKLVEAVGTAIQDGLDLIRSNSDDWSEWEAIVAARAGEAVPGSVIASIQSFVRENNGQFRKVTDQVRVVLALQALGENPRDIAGYDLIDSLLQHSHMLMQGVNGPAFVLIALANDHQGVPANAIWTPDKLVDWLLEKQNEDGGFGLTTGSGRSDVDLTAMVLQGLAGYQKQAEVGRAIEKALAWLSEQQQKNSGFLNAEGQETSESVAQVVIALTALGLDPLEDRFMKDRSIIDHLLTYRGQDGGFAHIHGQGTNAMATEQALLALVAYQRYVNKESALYDMESMTQGSITVVGYADEVDISDWAREAVDKAYHYGIMRGTGDSFEPQRELTRAELATLLVNWRGKAEESSKEGSFEDVAEQDWYYQSIREASAHGWMEGTGEDTFSPNVAVTREQLAVVLGRMLQLSDEIMASSVQIDDMDQASSWASPWIEQMVALQLMIGDGNSFQPQQVVTREMAATVIVRIIEFMYD